MSFDKIDIKVDGEQLKVDLTEELTISDISTDMTEVAAKMGFWGSVWAAAEGEQERVDSHYRQWRAEQGKRAMGADGKASEWKVKQDIEASPDFLKYKEASAKAIKQVTLAKAVFEAFRVKANQLQSMGARARSEMGATGMTTKSDPEEKGAKVDRGVSAMREANRKKRREEE